MDCARGDWLPSSLGLEMRTARVAVLLVVRLACAELTAARALPR